MNPDAGPPFPRTLSENTFVNVQDMDDISKERNGYLSADNSRGPSPTLLDPRQRRFYSFDSDTHSHTSHDPILTPALAGEPRKPKNAMGNPGPIGRSWDWIAALSSDTLYL